MAGRNHTTELGCIACAGKEGLLVNNPNLLAALDTHSIALANRSLVLIVLALGTSRGYLLIYSLRGDLIHKQIVSPGKILRLRVRGTKRDLTQDASAEEVCVVMSDVIARFDGSDFQNMLQRWFRERHSQFWDQRDSENCTDTFGRLSYQIWNVSKYGPCVDAAITGLMPPPLLELQSSKHYYCAITVGDDAVISAYRFSVEVLAFPLTCFKDYPRKGVKLTLSPSGTLAAITDSLGRILLLDTQALVVVRLWKGYRDASCLFVEMLAKKDVETSRSAYHERVKSDYCLCLAIHAPRYCISGDVLEIMLVLTFEFITADMADENRSASSNYSMCKRLHNAALFRSQLTTHVDFISKNDTPTTYFEVTKPIKLPKTKPCSYLVLKHDFAYTYGKPPVLANYTTPSNCSSQKISKIVLEWKTMSNGRQFDRIFGVWLGGVEIFRSYTAEPRPGGIIWTVKKDITRYYSLLMTNQTLAVYIANIIDSTYTGVYNVEIFVHFYPADKEPISGNSFKGFDSWADLIVPTSRNLPLNDGLWFEIENSTYGQSKEFKIPQNAYRAVLEIYVSFHENDEFWEVVVSLDDVVVGAIWPFTVIYTGGNILDGSSHNFSFSVTNALNVWYVDANLHLWLDKKSVKSEGKSLEYSSLPLSFSRASNFTGLDGSFVTNARRSITLTGLVKSSYGTVTTRSSQSLSYSNNMVMGNDTNLQIVDQIIDFNDTVYAKMRSFPFDSLESFKKFQFNLYSDGVEIGDQSYASISNVTLIFDEKRLKRSKYGSSASSVHNLQKAQGYMVLKDQSIDSGLAGTQQMYKYDDNLGCYFRNISSINYTVIYDKHFAKLRDDQEKQNEKRNNTVRESAKPWVKATFGKESKPTHNKENSDTNEIRQAQDNSQGKDKRDNIDKQNDNQADTQDSERTITDIQGDTNIKKMQA
ncbi:hypothetical protein RND71_037935 [Anisodus tanguticus]|uniref:Rab3-GAP regulatory subunit N-terminal domain-containing protein n=1 Tax=Anisodus tanguticus TaxID=243964 RepID=A0AAE1QY31_9SOLA|nr:hypothetical protein RND71_037935 [Anisodus tanguticus]